MQVRDAFAHFFALREQFYRKYKDELPQPAAPVLMTEQVDFAHAEAILGFPVHPDIKAYLSAYQFEMIEGFVQKIYVNLYGVQNPEDVEQMLLFGFSMGKAHFLDEAHEWYLGGGDPYEMYVNNTTGEVTAAIPYEQKSVHIADSIADFLMMMQCEL